MKIVLIGTNHSKDEEDIEVTVEYDGEDTWSFSFGKINFVPILLTPKKDVM